MMIDVPKLRDLLTRATPGDWRYMRNQLTVLLDELEKARAHIGVLSGRLARADEALSEGADMHSRDCPCGQCHYWRDVLTATDTESKAQHNEVSVTEFFHNAKAAFNLADESGDVHVKDRDGTTRLIVKKRVAFGEPES